MPQTPKVVEGDRLQVRPGQNIWQFLADGFEDAYPRQFLDALRKCFLPALSLFLRCGLVAGHAIVNIAFLGLADVEDAASILAVNENGSFRVGALPFSLGFLVLPFEDHVFGMAVGLPCGSL